MMVGEAYAEGMLATAHAVQRTVWRLREMRAELEARRAAFHAAWYCALPWPKRWLAMVLGL